MSASSDVFVHTGLPQRVVFGPGAVTQLPAELDRLSLRRTLVLCTPGREHDGRELAASLDGRAVGVHARARMHVPIATVREAVDRVRELGADSCVAYGGGSAVGLGKTVARETGLPLVAVATTYAGSEMTPVWGETEDNRKTTGRDVRVLPTTVIYDPELTAGLPLDTSVSSAVNALAHAVEALYAPDHSPLTDVMATQAARSLLLGLDMLTGHSDKLEDARYQLLQGAWLAGSVLAVTSMGVHHKLCHTLGGMFDLSHAWTHTIVLPHVMSRMLRPGRPGHAALAEALGSDSPGAALHTRLHERGYGRSLAELGMPVQGVGSAVDQALLTPYAGAHQLERAELMEIVARAHIGREPA